MADPTAQDYQDDIVSQFDSDDATFVSANVGTWWNLYGAQGDINLYLQYLYTQRHAFLNRQRATALKKVTARRGETEQRLSDLWTHYQQTIEQIQAEIALVEERAFVGGGAVGGVIQTAVPVASTPPLPGMIDANHPALRGSPYGRWPWRT